MPSLYLMVGVIVKPQGIRGEMKVMPYTDDPARFLHLKTVHIKRGDVFIPRKITSARIREGMAYIFIDGIADRDAAEVLRNTEIYVARSDAVELEENANFISDIIGCRVEDLQGEHIGVVIDILQSAGNDVYVIDTQPGRMMVPALLRAIPVVDVKNRLVKMDADVLREVAVIDD